MTEMPLSNLERAVLSEMARHDAERDTLEKQIAAAKVVERDYTGVGLYTKLELTCEVPLLKTPNRLIEDYPKLHLNHGSLEAGAGVILWLDKGMVSTIEFYTYAGDWPSDEDAFRLENAEPLR